MSNRKFKVGQLVYLESYNTAYNKKSLCKVIETSKYKAYIKLICKENFSEDRYFYYASGWIIGRKREEGSKSYNPVTQVFSCITDILTEL